MKTRSSSLNFLVLCSILIVGLPLTGSARLPEHLTETTRIAVPPAGRALVNFHRPSNWGGGEKLAIFDINGRMLIDLPGGSEFQLVCDPGEHVFVAWADHVTVVMSNLAADKVYDIMIDVGMGLAWRANIRLVPLLKGDARRERLREFEKREKRVVALNRNKHVVEYEAKNKARCEEISRDFLGGAKSDRVSRLQKDDCR